MRPHHTCRDANHLRLIEDLCGIGVYVQDLAGMGSVCRWR